MKKISTLAGIVAAAALLCGISGCDNSETITMTSAKIEMVGDPIVTGKAVIFQWKDSVANGAIVITRQAPGEEEVELKNDDWIPNGFADRVRYENLLEAGVEYTYRFYNTSGVSSARTTEYTLENKYGCVERKVKFESIDPEGTKLTPITEEQVTIKKFELKGDNYVSVYVDEKEAHPWINIKDKTTGASSGELYKNEIGGVELFKYNPSHTYEIWVGKWWKEDSFNGGSGKDDKRYYSNADTAISFDLPATKSGSISFWVSDYNDYFSATWSGKKENTYEVSFEAFDNQGKAVTLKKSKLAADDIKNDDFNNYEVTGKINDLIDIAKTAKTIKMILKETAKDGTVYESKSSEQEIPASFTKYTQLERGYHYGDDGNRVSYIRNLNVYGYPESTEDGDVNYYASVTLFGANLPATAKLYYKSSYDSLYKEVTGGLKKAEGSNYLTATVPVDTESYTYYDFKAVVTTDNKNWYDWEEGKTEEVAERTYWNYNNY